MEKETRQNKPTVHQTSTNPVLTDGSMVYVGKKHFLEMLAQLKSKSANYDKAKVHHLHAR